MRFERSATGGARARPMRGRRPRRSGAARDASASSAHAQLREELELLDAAGNAFDLRARSARASVTPVFFGSAMTNFGVEPFLDGFVELRRRRCRAPTSASARRAGRRPTFSGFVFKIQANMDPQHRDRIAFMRVVLRAVRRAAWTVHHVAHRASRSRWPAAAVPGAGAHDRRRGLRRATSSACGTRACCASATRCATGPTLEFEGIPRFSPEHFARVRARTIRSSASSSRRASSSSRRRAPCRSSSIRKRSSAIPILGAVGVLQFEVIEHRLQDRVRRHGPFETLALSARALGRGRRLRADKFERAPASTTCVLDVEVGRSCCSTDDWAHAPRHRGPEAEVHRRRAAGANHAGFVAARSFELLRAPQCCAR